MTAQKRLREMAKTETVKQQGDDTMSDPQAIIMDFSDALRALKDGKRIQRASWKNFKAYLYLRKMKLRSDLLVLHTMDKMPEKEWMPTLHDMLAEDWRIVE